tara:strand:+ start:1166 stop:1519 length:354 start_codon:yes stop_codon:yes gene_type:complete
MQAKLPHGNGRATEEVPCGFKSSISYQEVDKIIEEDWVKKIFESTGRRERSTERNIEVSLFECLSPLGKLLPSSSFFRLSYLRVVSYGYQPRRREFVGGIATIRKVMTFTGGSLQKV